MTKRSAKLLNTVAADAAEDVSLAAVAVGASIEYSVLLTANLVDLGIPRIWARAISKSHGTALERIGANHGIYPEAEAGERIAHLVSGRVLVVNEFDEDFVIVKMHPPAPIHTQSLAELSVRSKYSVTVVGVKAPGHACTYAVSATVVAQDDVIIGSNNEIAIERFAALQK